MDTYKHKFTVLQEEILELLMQKAGISLTQRDIAKLLKVSPTAIGNSLEKLKKQNLINIEHQKTMNLISFNREEKKAIELKRVTNLKNIYISGLSQYLFENSPGCAIILFGSYSKGEDTVKSDVDIAIIGIKNKKLDLDFFGKTLERQINLNFYESFPKIHERLKNNILSGIILSGTIS
jgi:predicted nucleotidyltransferase